MNTLGGLRALALVLLSTLCLFVALAPTAQPLRNAVFDRYQRSFPLDRTTSPVVIVAIDETALERYGQWPWPRTRVAQLIARLDELGAAAIGLDIVFPEPDRVSPDAVAAQVQGLPAEVVRALRALPSNDARLADAMRAHGGVVLGLGTEEVSRNQPPPRAAPVPMPAGFDGTLVDHAAYVGSVEVIDAAAAGRGLMNSGAQDQVVRVVPLVARVKGAVVPALGVETLRVAMGAGLRIAPGRHGAELVMGPLRTPVRDDGATWLRMGHHDESRFVSVVEVFEGKPNPERFRDKVVLVGIYGLGTFDFKTTPLGEFVPGVEVHAQVVENLFNGVKLSRPRWATLAEAAMLALFGLLLVAYVPRLTAMQSINVVLGMMVMLAGIGLLAFRHYDMLLDPAWPAIGTFAVYATIVIATLSEAERQRRQLRDQAARMAGEVDAARRIQMGLLPDPRQTLANDRRFALAATLAPARTVGGDFYDCFMIDEERLFFVVADVSGKGLPAALFMASVKSHIKSAALRGEGQVGDMLSFAQAEVDRENPEQLFVTAFAAVLHLASGRLEMANAGHEPPYSRTAEGAPERLLVPGGPPLCVVEAFPYPTFERQLVPGEWLCVVTDGVTEAMNPAKQFFGGERLRTTLSWMGAEVTPQGLVERVTGDLARFCAGAEPADDVTLLVLRWWGPGGAVAPRA